MTSLLTPDGSLALATAALVIVLGWRFTLARRARDVAGALGFVLAVAVTLAGAFGLVPGSPAHSANLPIRLAGAALLVGGLLLAGASFRTRRGIGPGVLCTGNAYARIRHPLFAGLSLALVGNLLRTPHVAGAVAVTFAVVLYAWLARREERDAAARFGAAWEAYAVLTPALWPRRGRPGGAVST